MPSVAVSGVRSLDYLAFSISNYTAKEVESLLGFALRGLTFGRYRYRQGAVSDLGVELYWENVNEEVSGCHVRLSGSGCRAVESREGFESWAAFLSEWIGRGAKFSRLDVAIDDLGGASNYDEVLSQFVDGVASCRASRNTIKTHASMTPGGWARSLSVGSRQSETFMRYYDKGRQLGGGVSVFRFEFEFKGARADALARLLAVGDWDTVVGSCRSFVEFKDRSHTTKDVTRRRVAEWWDSLMGTAKQAVSLGVVRVQSLERTAAWISRQVAKALAKVTVAEGGSIDWLLNTVQDGRRKLTAYDWRLLNEPEVKNPQFSCFSLA